LNSWLAVKGGFCVGIPSTWPVDVDEAERQSGMATAAKIAALERAGLVRSRETETEYTPLSSRPVRAKVLRYELTENGEPFSREKDCQPDLYHLRNFKFEFQIMSKPVIKFFESASRITTAVLLASSFLSVALYAQDTPSPALLITGTGGLFIANLKDQHIVTAIPTGPAAREVAVSADRKLAMVTTLGNTMSLIDLNERKELNRYQFNFPARPNSLVFVDGKFYFTAEAADSMGRYDPATRSVDAIIGLGQLMSHVLLYNPADKTFIVTSRNSNSVTFVDTVDIEYRGNSRQNWRVTPVPAGITFNEAMDLSPDGKELWTAEFRGSKVAILDVATRKVKETFNIPNMHSDRLKFTPDGKRVLFSDIESGELRVLDAATHRETQTLKLGKSLEGVNITPDGSTAYVCAPSDNDVSIVDLKTMTVTGHISVQGAISAVWIP
jgi:YVTN family beta-propeller protein